MTQATYIEQGCTFEHEGWKFESGGAVVTTDWLVAYPGDNGILNDWHGKPLGKWRVLSSWRVNSWIGSHMYSIECFVDGVRYVGRGFGTMMSLRAKRSPVQPKPVRLLECGCCGQYHPAGSFLPGGSANYKNDCRYDDNRYLGAEDFTKRTGRPCVEVGIDEQDFNDEA